MQQERSPVKAAPLFERRRAGAGAGGEAAALSPHLLLQAAALEASGQRDALVVYSRHGKAAEVERILREGCTPDSWERDSGESALHVAAAGGHLDCVRLLVEAGADTEARARATGHTPLQLAVAHKHRTVRDFLAKFRPA